ncbi:MAG: hypothetical protein Q9216_005837 [Gyalolechia sp. 2 TL-2023]
MPAAHPMVLELRQTPLPAQISLENDLRIAALECWWEQRLRSARARMVAVAGMGAGMHSPVVVNSRNGAVAAQEGRPMRGSQTRYLQGRGGRGRGGASASTRWVVENGEMVCRAEERAAGSWNGNGTGNRQVMESSFHGKNTRSISYKIA